MRRCAAVFPLIDNGVLTSLSEYVMYSFRIMRCIVIYSEGSGAEKLSNGW